MSKTSPQLTKESNNCHLYNIRIYKNGYCVGGYYFVNCSPTSKFVVLHKFQTYVNSCCSS